ncbi:multidrug efflux MFS transporter MdtH [Escherichia coli]|nr:multidrug efflux MFS transporter MdtH [Escherichia coli]EFC3997063.1 multidrug efflux MFS transporter MdtH [Escherichia coli]EGK7420076.1 multidrug efflux MFS transporter MdtH [Escherichia coli]HAN8283930.1 multidrug efflux MFS transporter MdtH [Escherichia coli]
MSRVSQARNLGKYFLLIDNMLVVLGFFVVFPLISIRFVDQMGWAAVMVGIALGLRQFIQQGLGIFGGAIADRFGAKPMIVTGMLMRAAGFATMGIAHEPWLLWFSCLLSGLGGTLFDPPRSALVVKLIRPQQRGRFFSLLMMQDSAGAVIGALLGSWLLQYDFRLVCATGAVLFVLCAAFNAWLLPAWKLSTVHTPVREGMTRVMRDKRFVTYVLTLAGYYMLAVQVMLMLPIMVNDVAGAPSAVKWMYAIEEWLRKVNGYANKLLLPRFAKSAFDEFSTPAARKYFVDKKEASAGNFADLLAHSDGLIKNISDDLRALDKLIVKPNAVNGELSEDDIQLFPLLRNLTLVAGINWPSRVADYRDNMAKQTQINLLSSMAI